MEAGSVLESKKEKEADLFATETLISSDEFEAFVANQDFSESSIKVHADKWGVHSSIVSGRLAHRDIINWKEYQKYRVPLGFNKHKL